MSDHKGKSGDLEAMRHSLAHIMATAVQQIWPKARFGVGPAVGDGFYYDIDLGEATISEEDFGKIEAAMRKVIKADQPFERSEMPIDEAIEWSEKAAQPYKTELLNDLKRAGTTAAGDLDPGELGTIAEGESKVDKVSFYRNGEFTDLCRGPHVASTGKVGAFKLMRVAGAYWRGDEKRPQMQRLYGVAFATEEDLDRHLKMLEEAKKRDHRRLGQELDLFTFSDLVGPGLPLYTPKGAVIIEELKNALKELGRDHDMQTVSIPHLAKLELYKTSGHAEKFEDELFRVKSHYDQEFVLKPVNCPHHTQIYAARPRSYRELPIRYVEQTMQYRDEKPGQIGGLQRTRGFTVDDGHTFCRVDQIEQEASVLVEIIRDFYKRLDLWGDHWVSLSVRDPATPDAYIGDPKDWDQAEKMLADVATEYKLGAKRMEGEAALYGPKIDFMFKDALGRETQLATIQLDFAMPKRFGLTYTDKDDKEVPPVMIHRAILGSFERFIMLLIEHTAGRFPIWLAPEQVRLITVNQEAATVDFAAGVLAKAKKLGLRAAVDNSNESVGKKIRAAELAKVPYTVVIGEKEIDSGEVTPRIRQDMAVQGDGRSLGVDEFLKTVAHEAKARVTKTSV
ncbi:MAG TPA: threonine--tRNA ligase [Candidatus Saccharimonadales bacterium]|nr:threonine--tRNA ligase [Candidatus Saccharimonadales bacterium]